MKKKMRKKKEVQRRLVGLLPIFYFESRYSRLYRDTRARMARQDTATTWSSMPAIRPTEGHDTAG